MTLSLGNLPYIYTGNTDIQNWLETSYGVKGFGSPTEDILSIFAHLKMNSGFNPMDSLDDYMPSLENSLLGDYQNDGKKYTSLPYYQQKDNEYYVYTGDYSGIQLATDAKGNDLINEETTALTTKVSNAMTSLNINSMSQDELTKLYKQLTVELQGLKETTLTNDEINDVVNEINTLNGAGVLENLESRIDKTQDELMRVFDAQLDKITTLSAQEPIKAIFKGEGPATDPNDPKIDQGEINKTNVISNAYMAGTNFALANRLFGDGTSSLDAGTPTPAFIPSYQDNAFYNYFVALRTNPNLTFKESLNQSIPEFNESDIKIADTTNFKMADYSGLTSGQQQLDPTDILDGLYPTQELLVLYKQYEETVNKANSMQLALTLAIQNSAEFDFRKELAAQVLAKINDNACLLSLSDDVLIAENIKRGSSVGPSARRDAIGTHDLFDGFYGDINTKAVPVNEDPNALIDPYEIVINGTKYIMGRDDNSNGTIDDVTEILGITDSMENPFQSLLQLDFNKDGSVSKDELIRGGVVLKAVDSSGKLTNSSYDLSLVSNINLSKLNPLREGNSVGTFEMTFLNGRTAQGSQTFENQAYFNTLFGKLVDLRPYQGGSTTTASTATTTKSTTNSTATTTTAAKTTETQEATTASNRTKLLNQINSMYRGLIIDDTSNVETILDNMCWKTSAILTPAQRIRIIDSIDPLMPVYQIESKINNALQTLNS